MLEKTGAPSVNEARILTNHYRPTFNFFERLKLYWLCGRLNSYIRHAAAKGETSTSIYTDSPSKVKYYREMAEHYEALGYFVIWYYSDFSAFIVFWDTINANAIQTIDNRCRAKYFYHTPSDEFQFSNPKMMIRLYRSICNNLDIFICAHGRDMERMDEDEIEVYERLVQDKEKLEELLEEEPKHE